MLKKIYLGAVSLGITALLTVSCNKDEKTEPTFSSSDYLGTWEVISGDGFVECPDGDNQIFEITETKIREGQTDEQGCDNRVYALLEYTYKNGNSFDVGLGVYKIKEIKDGKMTLEMSSPLAPGITSTLVLEKR